MIAAIYARKSNDQHDVADDPLVVREAQPSGTVRGPEDTVLFEQVVNGRLLALCSATAARVRF